MRFRTTQDAAKAYGWELVGTQPSARSIPKYPNRRACVQAITRNKNGVSAAPVDPAPESAGTAAFRLVTRAVGKKFVWDLVAKSGATVATSAKQFAARTGARTAAKTFQAAAPAATILAPQTFRIEETAATWGGQISLHALAPPTFGTPAGQVYIAAGTQRRALPVVEWEQQTGLIVAKLPASEPFPGPHLIVVEGSLTQGQMPIVVLSALTFTVAEAVPAWGSPITLHPAGAAGFGTSGSVVLHGPLPTQQVSLTVTAWQADEVVASLPPGPPFPGPYVLEVVTASAKGNLPIAITDVVAQIRAKLNALLAGLKLEAGVATVGVGDPLTVAIANFPPGSISLPAGDFPVQVHIEWGLTGPHVTGSDWWQHQPRPEGAVFWVVPRLVEADTQHAPQDDTVEITVSITLLSDLVTVGPVRLTLSIKVTPILLPAVALFFTHDYFKPTVPHEPGCVFAYVRPGSLAISAEAVRDAVSTLAALLSQVSRVFAAVPWLAEAGAASTGLSNVAESLRTVITLMGDNTGMGKGHKVRVESGAGVPFLDKVHFWLDFLYWHTGEDNFGSMCLIGPPGETMRIFNAREYSDSEGHFRLTIPERTVAAFVDTLHYRPPSCWPAEALSQEDLTLPPGGANFGNRLSSVHWGIDPPS
jgi:hypothetical protein